MSILEKYSLLVSFLGEVLGENCEVVLHDVTNLEHSIVAIANNEISGRQIGGPATDFVLKLMQVQEEKKVNYITNYDGTSYEGHKLRCSSYFIHEAGKVVGVLCLNYDITNYVNIRNALDHLVLVEKKISKGIQKNQDEHTSLANLDDKGGKSLITDISENFYHTADDAINHIINIQLDSYHVDSKRLSKKERLEVVSKLHDSGLFLLKGGISALAERLGISEPTLYRYLKGVKEKGK